MLRDACAEWSNVIGRILLPLQKNAIEIDYFTRIVNYYQFYGLKFCLLICLFVNLIYDLDQDDACIVNICYFNYRIVVITLF